MNPTTDHPVGDEGLAPVPATAMTAACVGCHKAFSHGFVPFCDACGDMVDIEYDLSQVRLVQSENPYQRFRDLLPVKDPALLPSDARYTPTVHARRLGAELGMRNLYLKNETVLPSGSTKDRMAAVALPYLWECGVRSFCTSSTGNSSTAYARAITRFPGFTMFLCSASDFHQRVQFPATEQVVHLVLRDATFVDAFHFAAGFAEEHGFVSERGFFNPGRREGLKLAWMEAVEQVPQPIDWYVQAVSSAMGVFGTFKAAQQLQGLGRIARLPRLLCVQQESCSPMVHAWKEGSEAIQPHHIVANPSGIAKAILRGDPTGAYPRMRRIVGETNGTFAAAGEPQIREARQMVEQLEDISPCFSASTALAGLIRQVRTGQAVPGRYGAGEPDRPRPCTVDPVTTRTLVAKEGQALDPRGRHRPRPASPLDPLTGEREGLDQRRG